MKVKLAIGFIIVLLLGRLAYKLILNLKDSGKSRGSVPKIDFRSHDEFVMKAVTTIIGGPEEIAQLLVDDKRRPLWDINLNVVTRQ